MSSSQIEPINLSSPNIDERKPSVVPLSSMEPTNLLSHLDERKPSVVDQTDISSRYVHETDARGNDHVTTDTCSQDAWKGLLEDGTSLTIMEDIVRGEFGSRFVAECKYLGHKKFVRIPVGSCGLSIMKIFPELRCKNAPPVKFMHGEIDTCVFSSLASAFHQMSILDLVRVANILQTNKSKSHCGVPQSLTLARNIVTENVKWLQEGGVQRLSNGRMT
jgi:hypothetical protein